MKLIRVEQYNWPKYLLILALCGVLAGLGMLMDIPRARTSLLMLAGCMAVSTTIVFAGQALYRRYRSR